MIVEMTNELLKYGNIEVIKNDYVFTLLMTKSNKCSLTSEQIPLKVLGVVTSYLGQEKSNIEVMKNEDDYLILILKP